MDINNNASINISTTYTPIKTSGCVGNSDISIEPGLESVSEKVKQRTTKDQEISKGEIDKITADLNKIMQLLNADLQFAIHEETQRIMVQLVDIKQQKVLKEFPPRELLDTLAAISECIGLMLDKKA